MNNLKDNDNGVQVVEEVVISIRYLIFRRQSADCARHVFPWYKTESYRRREQRAYYTYIALSPFVFDRMNFLGGSRDICEARDTVYAEKNDGWLKVEILIKFKLQAAENQGY